MVFFMINYSSEKKFLMLISSVNPDTDLIYQCRTTLCVKVKKKKISELQETTSAAIYKHADKSVYIFETIGSDKNDEDDVQAAIRWYLSYYQLGVQQEWK